jgi:uncharacterized protein (TIGR02001 family)
MKLTYGLAAAALSLTAMAASAEITGTIGAVSDYDFRSVSLSAKDPALQGSIDYAHDSGFYAGVWGSNIDSGDDVDGDIEVDLYLGIANQINDDLGYDVGIVYYTYPGSDDIDAYPEIYAGLTYKWFEFKQWYSNDNGATDEDAFYTEVNASFDLVENLSLGLHLGYNYGDYFTEPSVGIEDEYLDYSVGLNYTLGHFDLGLKYVDNDMDHQVEDDVFNSEGRVIFSISTTFPWSE